MKYLFILLFAIFNFGVTEADSSTILRMHLNNGHDVRVFFNEKPVISYSKDNLVLTTKNIRAEYPYSSINKIEFFYTSMDVKSMVIEAPLSEGTTKVYDLRGELVKQIPKDQSLNIDELKDGIFIIKNNIVNYKIVKR